MDLNTNISPQLAYLMGYLLGSTFRSDGEKSNSVVQKLLFDIDNLKLKTQDNYYLLSK